MDRMTLRSKGFTLIASLLLLLILSAISVGLLMMVNTEVAVNGGDLQNTVAYHNAEGGIEKMTSDLSATFRNIQSPQASDICNLSSSVNWPNIPGVTWKDYSLTPSSGCSGPLTANFGQIQSGPNTGLWAQIIPVTLLATAQEPMGQEVSMMRRVDVALIPVFQFGVFSDSDLGFYSSPDLDFAGRVHTNGDLYLGVANCCKLTFHDKLSAYGNVVRAVLPNGLAANSFNDSGTVKIPTTSQGCDPGGTGCRTLGANEGSVQGAGGNPPASSQNSNWPTISLGGSGNYNGFIIDGNYGNPGGTGAKNLSLPFVNGTTFPYEIIRRPPAGESATSALGASRLYNQAQIRVLLSDDPAELSPGGAADAQNVRLANIGNYRYGVAASVPGGLAAPPAGQGVYTTYFATASTGMPDISTWNKNNSTVPDDWALAPASPATNALKTLYPNKVNPGATYDAPKLTAGTADLATVTLTKLQGTSQYPYFTLPAIPTYYDPSNTAAPAATNSTWNLIDGYLRVEYKDAAGNWNPVTQQWLSYGIARGTATPAAPGTNTVNPNAILIFQEPADRNGDGNADSTGAAASGTCSGTPKTCQYYAKPPEVVIDNTQTNYWSYGLSNPTSATESYTMYNWYPINFYDTREGEPRDTNFGNNSCTANGVMNIVELDVGNLKRWLNGTLAGNGANVDFLIQNGYILYFSDRRGMLPSPNVVSSHPANTKSGDSGLEDDVNAASAAGTPDGVLEAAGANVKFSPEDVNQNKQLENFGGANLGLGFYNGATNINAQIYAAAPDNPYSPRINSCANTGRKNWVSGARHALRLVDGSLGNVPVRLDNNLGGFTVASENPVYIQGNYNTNPGDPIWNTPPGADQAHAASAVIADAVTVLSNNWSDLGSTMNNGPTQAQNFRPAQDTYYRVAIAGGKNMNFPFPNWENNTDYGFGTDGGVHNFLRFLEDWQTPGATLNYEGSLVSMYYATYATGLFKCCTYSVYQPPTRNYIFDPNFATPQGLPPGTPMFRDVDSLTYRQYLDPRTY